MRKKQVAQSFIEYAVCICVLVAALMAMRFYINRGFQGRLRQAGQEIGEGYFYSPGGMTASRSEINQVINETMVSSVRKPTADEVTGGVTTDPDANVMVSEYTMNSTRDLQQQEHIVSYSDDTKRGGL